MIDQFEYNYTGLNGVRSRCNIMMFSDDGDNFICFENLGNGVSVTNASEILASEIVNMHDFNPGECRFFETYREYNHETFDEVEYDWSKRENNKRIIWEAKNPKWKATSQDIKDIFIV